ncbi:hypothetical protein B0H11DRAFT_1388209 [Mycena galericulata]|nr:hypothetical protein B0H11DRAFT_1388209 [Mycena galericulata]
MPDLSSLGPRSSPRSVDHTFIMTWGADFIAYTLDTALWGVTMISVLKYFRKYTRKDPLAIRSMVALLATFSTVHSLFLAMDSYKIFVSLFGDFEGIDKIMYEADVAVFAVFLNAFTAQMFYASRIWILSNQDWRYVTPVILLALLQLAFGIAQTVGLAVVNRNSRLDATVVTSTAQAVASLACDIAITAILLHILRRSRTGVKRTDSVLDKMIIYAFNRGAMTSLMALLQFILFIALPGTFVFSSFFLPSCHVYVISVCSMLTSRETLRAELRSISTFTMPTLPTLQSNSTHNNPTDESSSQGVHVSTSVVKWVENIPADDNNKGNRDTHKIPLRHTMV